MPYYKLMALGLISLMLTGCPAQPIPDPDPVDTTYGGDSGADTDGYNDGGTGYGGPVGYDDPSAGELASIIYFDFDSSDVRAEDAEVISRHAVQLSNSAGMSIRLEGHADERGSREYNIGLGERRSQAVRRMLLIQGASAAQIATVSFGEERPVELGSSEGAYAQNRRVEIKYTD